jgi:hypothetical protein
MVAVFLFGCTTAFGAGEERSSAFQILEDHVQGRAVALESRGRGLEIFGTVAGSGLLVGTTWGGLYPALYDRSPGEENWGYGALFGVSAGAAAQILALSIAHLVHPPPDLRAAYSAVLDETDPFRRERAALATIREFSERSRQRRKLAAVVSIAAIVSPIVAHASIAQAAGNLDTYGDIAWGFSLATAGMLYFTIFQLWDEDPASGLYSRYLGAAR